eukprot:scaffold2613_cov188-Amphora_coffeaeformis.AAC.5
MSVTPYSSSRSTLTQVYLFVWCLHLLQPWTDRYWLSATPGGGALDTRPLVPADGTYLLPLVVTTLLLLWWFSFEDTTSKPTKASSSSASTASLNVLLPVHAALVSHVVDWMVRFDRMPAVWDHEFWGLMVNLAFIACYTMCTVVGSVSSTKETLATAETWFVTLVRLQFGILYAAATFWKFTSSFLNPTTSCGTVVVLELIGSYAPEWKSDNLTQLLVQAAPHLTLLVEGALALGFGYLGFYGARHRPWVRDATLLVGTVFHLSIAMMPTNYAAGFSLECMTRFILLLDDTVEWRSVLDYTRQSRTQITRLGVALIVLPVLLCHWRWNALGMPVDAGFLSSAVLTVLHSWLVMATRSAGTSPPIASSVSCWKRRVVYGSVLSFTAFYAFATPILGIMQQSAPTMYANLRYYRGGNHYVVPMSILGEDILFGGGLVQVVASTSWSLNLQVGDMPSRVVFPPRVIDLLEPFMRQEGSPYSGLPLQLFPMCLFNPSSRAVMLGEYLTYHSVNNSKLLAPVILPISTVRQALQRSQMNNESYVVDVSDSLDVHPSTMVRLSSDGSCHHVMNGKVAGACLEEDTVQDNRKAIELLHLEVERPLPALSWFWQPIVDKLLAPYPELVGLDEEICMT